VDEIQRRCIVTDAVLSYTQDPWSGFCLTCSLHLQISLAFVELDHGGRLPATGSLWAAAEVEGDPPPGAGSCPRPGLQSVQVDAFLLQGPLETLVEVVVEEACLA
jgi:hypothetical protein